MGRIYGKEVLANKQASRNNTTYSSSMRFDTCTGDVGAIVLATGANTYAITQQCSLDNINWYDAVNGAMSAVGALASSTTAAISTWVYPTLVPAPYIRFKIVESANAADGLVTIILVFSEDM
jgi:hypothetical protein